MEIVNETQHNEREGDNEFWGEVPTIEQARKKLLVLPGLKIEPNELNFIRAGEFSYQAKILGELLFSQESVNKLRRDIKKIIGTDEFHDMIYPEHFVRLDEGYIYKNIDGENDIQKSEEAFRIKMLLNHSVDVNILKLRVKNWETQGKISAGMANVFYEDRTIQERFIGAMAANFLVREGMASFSMAYDKEPIEVLARRWTRLADGSEEDKAQIISLFVDEDGNPSDYIVEGKNTDIAESIMLADIDTPNIDYKDELLFGRINVIAEQERRVEEVRFLMMVEKKINEIFSTNFPSLGNFPEVDKFKIKTITDPENVKSDETYSSWAARMNGVIVWNHGKNLEGGCEEMRSMTCATSSLVADREKDGADQLNYLRTRLDLNALVVLTHEITHLWYYQLFEEEITGQILARVNSDGETVKRVSVWKDKNDKTVEIEKKINVSRLLWNSFTEGMSIFTQGLMIDYLLKEAPIELSDEDRKALQAMKRTRGLEQKLYDSEYGEGQKIIWSIYRDAMRGDTQTESESRNGDPNIGIKAVVDFLKQLDVNKITDLNSRKIFDEATIDDELVSVGHDRFPIEYKGETFLYESKTYSKNKILDYLASGDPEKRRRGREKILELFGK